MLPSTTLPSSSATFTASATIGATAGSSGYSAVAPSIRLKISFFIVKVLLLRSYWMSIRENRSPY